jgi:hypothetical protein
VEQIVAYIAAILTAASFSGTPARAADSEQAQPPAAERIQPAHSAPVSPDRQEAAKKARRDYAGAKKKAQADYRKAVSEAKAARRQALDEAKAAHDKALHDISLARK